MKRPVSVGLGGDGDEIAAIEDVERCFGITLDIDDAENWVTAGDLFGSMARSIPNSEASINAWDEFGCILCDETGEDWKLIVPESPLLAYSLNEELKHKLKRTIKNA